MDNGQFAPYTGRRLRFVPTHGRRMNLVMPPAACCIFFLLLIGIARLICIKSPSRSLGREREGVLLNRPYLPESCSLMAWQRKPDIYQSVS